jgi:hypothetical protein
MPFLVRCPIGIDCILDLMIPAHLSLGRNYAEFPYFYLKPPAGQCADLATKGRTKLKRTAYFSKLEPKRN